MTKTIIIRANVGTMTTSEMSKAETPSEVFSTRVSVPVVLIACTVVATFVDLDADIDVDIDVWGIVFVVFFIVFLDFLAVVCSGNAVVGNSPIPK